MCVGGVRDVKADIMKVNDLFLEGILVQHLAEHPCQRGKHVFAATGSQPFPRCFKRVKGRARMWLGPQLAPGNS